jgi:hypothetical protein
MLIRVMYRDGTYDIVKDIVLDKLIQTEKILKFYRSGHWATMGREPVRGMGGSGTGYRRRSYDSKWDARTLHYSPGNSGTTVSK